MRLVALISVNKKAFYEKIVAEGGEGVMLKDLNASYVQEGRPKSMFKAKKFEEVDAYVVDGRPGEEGKGWERLVGDVGFACVTETGKIHLVARCANLTLEQRIEATVCGLCGGILNVEHCNEAGKRVVKGTNCSSCKKSNVPPVLNPKWQNRVAEIRGQEWSARVFRLEHARIMRWRVEGVDAKAPHECSVNLEDIKRRAAISAIEL